jgi:antitoxin component of MazEF toxin-antitoxin module
MSNRRNAKAVRVGKSLAVILPADWVRGHDLGPGDPLTVEYDGRVSVRAVPKEEEAENG